MNMQNIDTHTGRMAVTGPGHFYGDGVRVDTAMTPTEALQLAGMDWTVEQSGGVSGIIEGADGIPTRHTTETHVLNVRSDTGDVLGIVGAGYQPVQNTDLADFAYTLADEGGPAVKVDAAGYCAQGKRTWMLCKGESFDAFQGDEIAPYLLIANGNDGGMALTITPTSTRMRCSNQLHMASRGVQGACKVKLRHSGDMDEKIAAARLALQRFQEARAGFVQTVHRLNAATLTRDQVAEFFVQVYMAGEGIIPQRSDDVDLTPKESRQVNRAASTVAAWSDNFDADAGDTGSTAWAALNAVTKWYDHGKATRGAGGRLASNWWGTSAERKGIALDRAMALATA